MKTYLFLPALALVLASCSKYQMNMLSSTNMTKDSQTGKFSTENDSVKITYSFTGQNAPIKLDVFNKLNEPLYIDWQRSDFIEDNKAISYADNMMHITGGVSGSSVGNRGVSYSSGSIDATATLPKNVIFIPPHAQVSNTLIEASNQFFNLPDSLFIKKEISSTSIERMSKVKTGEFNQAQSPFNFKSYLTMYTLGSNNQPKFVTYQHNFYVSKIIQLNESPEYYEFFNRGDYYYTKQGTAYGKVGTGLGVAALVVGTSALNASMQNNTK